MKNKIIFFLFLFFVYNINSQDQGLILDEAKKRNITTTEDAIIELNKNGISLSQAREIARLQGIDLVTFLNNNFESSSNESSKLIASSEVVDNIKIVSENQDSSTITNNFIENGIESNQTYFGYEIFNNNPFASKNYLIGNIDEGYLLSPGDELRITVYGNNALTTESKIDLNGNIIFPDLGVFQAAGNSLKTLKQRLKIFLGKFYNGLVSRPQQTFLDVSLTQIRPVKVNVLGDVKTPGPHLVNGLASVLNALYAAGGVNTNGSLRKILVYRNNKLLKEIDLYNYITKGNIDGDVRLMSSDFIFVPSRLSSVTLNGIVKKPAIYELKKDETLENLIVFSGGFSSDASQENLNLSRTVPFDDRLSEDVFDRYLTTISFEPNKSLVLNDGDIITVKPILDKVLNVVTLTGNVNNTGTFSTLAFPNLKSLIENGGKGVSANTFFDKVDVISEDLDGDKSFNSYNLSNILDGTTEVLLKQDDIIKVYSLNEVMGEKFVTVSGFGIDDNTISWRENLSIFDLIFESSSLYEPEFKSKVLSTRIDVDEFNPKNGQYTTKIFSLDRVVELKNTFLKPKDRVRLYSEDVMGEINPSVIVAGFSKNPKRIDLNENMLVEDAIIKSDGFEDYAITESVDIVRQKIFSKDKIFSETLKYDIDKDYLLGLKNKPNNPFILKKNDVVVIRKFKRDGIISTVELSGEVNLPGTYSYPSIDITLKDIINRSDGLTEYAFLNSTKFTRNGSLVSYKNKTNLLNKRLQEGDQIEIGSILDDVKILGDGVLNSTSSTWVKNKKAKYYIRNSGGLNGRIKSKVVLRANGSTKKIKSFLGNPLIYPGDTIFVTKKPEKNKSDNTFSNEFIRIFGFLSSALTTILLVTKL